jgi:hypothetical protein
MVILTSLFLLIISKAVAAARMKGEYRYRVGQPECQVSVQIFEGRYISCTPFFVKYVVFD